MKHLTIIKILFISIVVMACAQKPQPAEIALIPQPNEITTQEGSTPIGLNLAVKSPKNLLPTLKTALSQFTISESGSPTIEVIEDSSLPEEHYTLNTTQSPITISTSSPSGLFYACQTLLQLLPSEILGDNITAQEFALPKVAIKDGPHFKWRGLMLDASRHFQTIPEVKRFIDNMAHHKLNVFHWHLTDGHGWRFESKKYPKLTEVGAWRMQPGYPEKGKTERYGGFYTQEEMKDVVAYAQARGVTIVPEIDMPGHSFAAIAAYPELGCLGTPQPVAHMYEYPLKAQRFPHIPNATDVLCVANEETITFCKDILDEVMEIFPSEYIHIGGDEVEKSSWRNSAYSQEFIKANKLEGEDGLQSWFIQQMDNYLTSKNRILVGWDEILQGGLAQNATVMSWQGEEGGIRAATMQHDVVMSPQTYIYLDHGQTNSTLEPPHWPGHNPLKKVYNYSPVPKSLTPEQAKHILGIQGNVWTIFVHQEWLLDICTWPRAGAIAETGWTAPENKNWNDFFSRLSTSHRKRMDNMGINYWWEEPHKIGNWNNNQVQEKDTPQTGEYDITATLNKLPQATHILEFAKADNSSPIFVKTIRLVEKGKDGGAKEVLNIPVEKPQSEFSIDFPEVKPNHQYSLEVSYISKEATSGTIYIHEVQTKDLRKLPHE
ncbi:beta-N-acetylhexosaminidase [Flagellimonas onchidii]|uniref:beta-N-acetylhexosaminidase n=1 Tax=Flagellimonas onchidii TaxID=2562684 RepID=UPI0010A62A38|nr:beta-N-acetylhexosaminidase [Allomuricauda onchidii]